MEASCYIPLPERTLLQVKGPDAPSFLQSLLTCDIEAITEEQAGYGLMLTPQGKFLFETFVILHEEAYWLDTPAARVDAFLQKLKMYCLRSNVTITRSDTHEVCALIGPAVFAEGALDATSPGVRHFCTGVAYLDPRSRDLFGRGIIEKATAYAAFEAKGFTRGAWEAYETLRLQTGVPDGAVDLEPEASFPLQYGMEKWHAISFTKGCYVGQEVTARTHHRGKIRKALFRIHSADGKPLPPPGTPVLQEGKTVGQIRSSLQNKGLALLECAATETGAPLTTKEQALAMLPPGA